MYYMKGNPSTHAYIIAGTKIIVPYMTNLLKHALFTNQKYQNPEIFNNFKK